MLRQEIKFPCNQCPSNFTQKGSLKKHIQSVHEGVKHQCNLCQYKATLKGDLKKQIKFVHKSVNIISV